ncbi:MAG: hypothetical protein QQN58_04115 [Nitrosopumilus sp.]|nr:hypothetical protein [Nitrososphaerota archaeon]
MVKIRVRSGRGTRIIEVDSDATKWTGAEYKAIQESKKKVAANTMVSSGRGTGRRRLGDIPEPKTRPEYKGTMTSGRGTGKKKK